MRFGTATSSILLAIRECFVAFSRRPITSLSLIYPFCCRAFFKAVVPPLGPIVNHDAEKSQDDEAEIKARQEKTKEVRCMHFYSVCRRNGTLTSCVFFNLGRCTRLSSKKPAPSFEHDDSPRPRKKQKVLAPEVVIIRNPFNVIVQTLTGSTSQFEIGPNNTVRHLKLLYQGMHHVPHDQQRLIFAGAQMKDENTLAGYNIVDGSTVQQVLKIKGC